MIRKMWRKAVAVTLAAGMLLGIGGVTNTAEAASKLSKKDFVVTGEGPYVQSEGAKKVNTYEMSWPLTYCNDDAGWLKTSKSKIIKTKRGIRLGDSKAKVLNAYGKVAVKNSTYKKVQKIVGGNLMCTGGSEKKEKKILKKAKKYVQYKYKKKSIYFFFDKNNKVNMITIE